MDLKIHLRSPKDVATLLYDPPGALTTQNPSASERVNPHVGGDD